MLSYALYFSLVWVVLCVTDVSLRCLWFSISFGLFTQPVESYLFSTRVSIFINLALRLAPAVDVMKFILSAYILYTYQLDIYYFCRRLPGLLEAHKVPNSIQPVAVYFTFFLLCIVIHLLEFKPTNAHNFSEITIIF